MEVDAEIKIIGADYTELKNEIDKWCYTGELAKLSIPFVEDTTEKQHFKMEYYKDFLDKFVEEIEYLQSFLIAIYSENIDNKNTRKAIKNNFEKLIKVNASESDLDKDVIEFMKKIYKEHYHKDIRLLLEMIVDEKNNRKVTKYTPFWNEWILEQDYEENDSVKNFINSIRDVFINNDISKNDRIEGKKKNDKYSFILDIIGKELLDDKEKLKEYKINELHIITRFYLNKFYDSSKGCVNINRAINMYRALKHFVSDKTDVSDVLQNFYKQFAESLNLSRSGKKLEKTEKLEKLRIIGRSASKINLKKTNDNYYIFNGEDRFDGLVGSIRVIYTFREFIEEYGETLGIEFSDYDNKYIAVSVEIRSRFDKELKRPYFLLEMLTMGNIVLNDYYISGDDEAIFDCLLLSQLKNYLLNAAQKGIYKTYRRFEDNLNKVKGSINIPEHIKLNAGIKNGKVACSYREKSANNYLNHLIMAAYHHLKDKYYDSVVNSIDSDPEAYEVVKLLKNVTEGSSFSNEYLIKKNESPISHPYFAEYDQVRELCLSVLRDEGFSWYGNDDEVGGILYYVPDLWEEYIEHALTERNIWVESQKGIKIFDEKTMAYPDYVLKDRIVGYYMVLDAKFIPFWKKIHDGEKPNRRYLHGDYNKCIRDMNAIGAEATGVIIPYEYDKKANETHTKVHTVSENNKTSIFYTVTIPVAPTRCDNESFIEWQWRFQNDVDKEIDKLKDLIEKEKEYRQHTIELQKELSKLEETNDDSMLLNVQHAIKKVNNSLHSRSKDEIEKVSKNIINRLEYYKMYSEDNREEICDMSDIVILAKRIIECYSTEEIEEVDSYSYLGETIKDIRGLLKAKLFSTKKRVKIKFGDGNYDDNKVYFDIELIRLDNKVGMLNKISNAKERELKGINSNDDKWQLVKKLRDYNFILKEYDRKCKKNNKYDVVGLLNKAAEILKHRNLDNVALGINNIAINADLYDDLSMTEYYFLEACSNVVKVYYIVSDNKEENALVDLKEDELQERYKESHEIDLDIMRKLGIPDRVISRGLV